jgi:hypothetical protein
MAFGWIPGLPNPFIWSEISAYLEIEHHKLTMLYIVLKWKASKYVCVESPHVSFDITSHNTSPLELLERLTPEYPLSIFH